MYQFIFCILLKNISLPFGCTGSLVSTFSGCKSLQRVCLPDGITYMESAFYGCEALQTAVIPASLERINTSTFRGCTALDSVIVRQVTPLAISSGQFEKVVYENATLYVPKGRKTYYEEEAGWKNFKKIKEIDMEGIEVSNSPYDNIREDQMAFGYYRGNECVPPNGNGYGGAKAGLYKACIGFDEAQIKPVAGNRIVNIRFALVNENIKKT